MAKLIDNHWRISSKKFIKNYAEGFYELSVWEVFYMGCPAYHCVEIAELIGNYLYSMLKTTSILEMLGLSIFPKIPSII